MEQDLKKLELRIQELENQLKEFSVPKIDPKEMEIFLKVAAKLGIDVSYVCQHPQPYVCSNCHFACRVCSVCRPCIAECNCGPCNIGPYASAGLSRFSELGI